VIKSLVSALEVPVPGRGTERRTDDKDSEDKAEKDRSSVEAG
jgi:hypothetical protein